MQSTCLYIYKYVSSKLFKVLAQMNACPRRRGARLVNVAVAWIVHRGDICVKYICTWWWSRRFGGVVDGLVSGV